MALGIGLVILAEPSTGASTNNGLKVLGWSVVALGAVLLAMTLIGAALSLRRARFSIDCGAGELFQKKIPGQERHRTPIISEPVSEVRVTRLHVREVAGRSAKDVKVEVFTAYPGDPAMFPKILPYVDGSLGRAFGPREGHHVRLCEQVVYGWGETRTFRIDSHVPVLDTRESMEIHVRSVVDGRPGRTQRFMCEWLDGEDWPVVRELTT